MAGIENVLMVCKKSLLERERGNPEIGKLSDAVRRRLLEADLENRQTINDVFYTLVRARVTFELVGREEMKSDEGFDLVIVVGGDGTFFAASHHVKKAPMLLVNSDPKSSLGLFSSCDRTGFPKLLDDVLAGRARATVLNRFNLVVGSVRHRVINDVLFSAKNPVSMTRYTLRVDDVSEEQEGSGLWISTAAGSTAAVFSAGGTVMPIDSKEIQYVVREPYMIRRRYRLLKGFARGEIEISSQTMEAGIWVDGARKPIDVPAGGKLTIRTPGEPLTLLGWDDARRNALASGRI